MEEALLLEHWLSNLQSCELLVYLLNLRGNDINVLIVLLRDPAVR